MSNNFQFTPKKEKMREFTVGADDQVAASENEFYNVESVPHYPEQPSRVLSQEERLKIQEERRKLQDKLHRAGEFAKNRAEILGNLGRVVRDVNVDGVLFSLRTLKSKELRMCMQHCLSSARNDIEMHLELRKYTLAHSVYQIDGQDIRLILGSDNFEDRLNFVDEVLEDVVVAKLYNEYNILKGDVERKFGVVNEEGVKEVVADLKK